MQTSLHNSPFALLGVSTRDKADRIVEQAEEKSLFVDSDICNKARGDLTTVRNRLSTEIRWLPGASPNKANSLLNALLNNTESVRDESSLPPLAKANVLAAAIEVLSPDISVLEWHKWIVELAVAVEEIYPDDVLREINADRSLSGFSELRGTEQIEEELVERYRYYTDTIKSALNQLPPMKLVEVVTDIVEECTDVGDYHAPRLIHDMVDRYEMEANRFLEAEAENIHKLVKAIRENSINGEVAIKHQIDKLDQIARKWDAIAQPIQISMKAQGIDHKLSHDVAWEIRSLAVDLFNKHDMVSTVRQLTQTLQELFAELPAILERLEDDREAINEIVLGRELEEKQRAERNKEITYETELGVIFKDKLRISPNGVEWKGSRIPLADVTTVRWGAVRKNVNGIPAGVDYTIAVGGSSTSEFIIQTTKEQVYNHFTDCLWKAVCVRLIQQYLKGLKEGKTYSIGEARFDDNGIHLTKHKFFGNEKVYESWGNVTYGSYSGSLQITSQNDKKTYVLIPYLEVSNAHILEAMVRLSFKNWKGRLSGLLD